MNHRESAKHLLFGCLSVFVLALMLAFLPSAVAQRTSILSVSRSNVVVEVSERARQSAPLSPGELARTGMT